MLAIRGIEIDDAEALLTLLNRLDEETKFMLFEPGERATTVEGERDIIKKYVGSDTQVMLVAEGSQMLVGFIVGIGGKLIRNRHSMYLAMGVLSSHWGQRIGYRLLDAIEDWADKHNIHRLELTVMQHNQRAINLYKKVGFQCEGLKKHSLRVEKSYVDEIYMGKLI